MRKKNIPRNSTNALIMSSNSPFNFIEANKTLRTNLDFITDVNDYKTIMITSSVAEEGKTTTAINLAISLGQICDKVLLIDCDMRKPSVHKYLKLSPICGGLTSVLKRKSSADEVIYFSEEYGISVLSSEPKIPNPVEELSSTRMDILIDELREKYNYIIIDTAPISIVTDIVAQLSRQKSKIFIMN